ncbi:HNH endonuclease [Saccharibacillus kuerlensis]|uniref:HNH nuclease domain-containing protein n=1 Tax=Saccharibacillus kuerlensis TaxID=459527 RepID=A0ABQ2KUK6_9BACL|nr:HNH endonuclease [Saccharibacillus kuerlensis]GGN93815.1 hypothetical protein GCM10010969_07950 [Saccharibacillus kuerlensis]
MGRKRSRKRTTDETAETRVAPPEPASSEIESAPTTQDSEALRSEKRSESAVTAQTDSSGETEFSNETQTDGSVRRKRKRRRKKRSGANANTAADGNAKIQTDGEPSVSMQSKSDPGLEDSEEAAAQKREEPNSSAEHKLTADQAAKPRKRRRKRRRGGAKKPASPSDDIAAPGSGESSLPDLVEAPAAESGRPEEPASQADSLRDGGAEARGVKLCLHCGEEKPLGDFLRRTGKRSGSGSRRGTCRDCRNRRQAAVLEGLDEASDPLPPSADAQPPETLPAEAEAVENVPKRRVRRPPPQPPTDALREPTREAELRPTRQGTIRMRGRTDKGRRWQQETDLEMARCLVREHAAVVVNRFTIRRLYTNRSFRRYILERDHYTCHFCGEYGDTIDHLLPRAKGGHTTPLNCVCACMLCNQNKADRDLDEFMEDAEPFEDVSNEERLDARHAER